jgi:hypothetical protein
MTEILDRRGARSHSNGPYQWRTARRRRANPIVRRFADYPHAGHRRPSAGGGEPWPAWTPNLVRLGALLQRIRRRRPKIPLPAWPSSAGLDRWGRRGGIFDFGWSRYCHRSDNARTPTRPERHPPKKEALLPRRSNPLTRRHPRVAQSGLNDGKLRCVMLPAQPATQ